MNEWHCGTCGMDCAAATQPEKCPACGGTEVTPRVSPMALSHPLPDFVVERVARRFRTLGDPIRIRLLERMRAGEASMAELVMLSETTPQNVSKHLGVLVQNGVVVRRKQGTASYYRVADEAVFALCEQVCESIEREFDTLGTTLAGARV